MNSEFIGLALFLVVSISVYCLSMSRTVEVTQCPGSLLTKTKNLASLKELGHLPTDLSKCETKTITLKELYEIRRLQKDTLVK
jgi:hypothetical protein